jgi:photosystem II stability/assembly factor-like uncharacterized protein
MPIVPTIQELNHRILAHMDDNDLRPLVLYLSDARNDPTLRYDNLGGTFGEQVINLIQYCRDNCCMGQFIDLLKINNPIVLSVQQPPPDPVWDDWAKQRDAAIAKAEDTPAPSNATTPAAAGKDTTTTPASATAATSSMAATAANQIAAATNPTVPATLPPKLTARGTLLGLPRNYLLITGGAIAIILVALVVYILIRPPSQMPITQELRAVQMLSATDGWASGVNGVILHYSSGVWQPVSSPTVSDLFGLDMLNANEGWAVGTVGAIAHYSGGNWAGVDGPTRQDLRSVALFTPTDGWAVGFGGTLLHYNGSAWTAVTSTTSANLFTVFALTSTDAWAAGDAGTILHYNGNAWTAVSNPTNKSIRSLAMFSDQEGWAVCSNGYILHYSGGRWQMGTTPTGDNLFALARVSATEGWAVGGGFDDKGNPVRGIILHYKSSTTGSGQWLAVSSPTDQALLDINMLNANEGWAVGTGGTILHYKNGTWSVVNP